MLANPRLKLCRVRCRLWFYRLQLSRDPVSLSAFDSSETTDLPAREFERETSWRGVLICNRRAL